ncbi:YceI family protein [Psychroserpens sp. MEBiC05023]
MKNNIFKTACILVLALSFTSFTAFVNGRVDIKDATITWKGHKVTGSHEGTINLAEGALLFEDNYLAGGTFSIDMTSITVTDLEAGSGKEKLEGHLKSDDFFGTANHKTATLRITDVDGKKGVYKVTGDLTIKGITHPITFSMNVSNNTATASLKIDRTKYDIKYGSASFIDGLKDKAIYDEFDLNVTLKF